MKFTLYDCVARINQALNYPSVAYEDIYHFFDHAIAELNTSLRIALPSVSEMKSENTFDITKHPSTVLLTSRPSDTNPIDTVTSVPTEKDSAKTYVYYYNDKDLSTNAFYKWNGTRWDKFSTLYGIIPSEEAAYVAVAVGNSAYWRLFNDGYDYVTEFDLCDYLPMDWWVLFIIPYVCYKYTVRDGDTGEIFSDEYVQGFQQLQTSYNVPNTVKLINVAGRNAYKNIVTENAENLCIQVPTRAIYADMRSGNITRPVYGGFYERGGWGV